MGNENGTWIMYGVEWDDPECLHTVQDAINYINEVGFLPLFKNNIPGFSLEERTVPEYWWCGDPEVDPWEWQVFGIGDNAATHIEKLLYDEDLDVDIQDRSHFI